MTDLTRLRAAYARRNTVFASEGKAQLSDAELRELHDALVEAGPGLLSDRDRLRRQVAALLSEIDFVISGGDDPHDRCTECGLAGIGMLRDERKNAVELLKEIK